MPVLKVKNPLTDEWLSVGGTGSEGPPGPPGVDGAPGPQGPPGTAYLNAQWNFNQNTVTSPNSGTMRMDNTVYANTTQLYVHEVDRDGLNRALGLDLCVVGDQIIMQSAQGRAVWTVIGAFDVGTYRTFNVTLVESSGVRPSASSPTTLYFVTVGEAGGTTILSGTAAPGSGVGVEGNYYLDTDDHILYGPKQAIIPPTTASLFTSQTPTAFSANPNFSYGTDITFAVSGSITQLKFYRHVNDTSPTKKLSVFTTAGTLLGTVTATGLSGSGWKSATLSSSVAVTAGQTLRIVYYAEGNYHAYGSNTAITNGALSKPLGSYFLFGDAFPTTADVALVFTDVGFQTAAADPWPIALKSVPPGGTTGQYLKKLSNTDYAVGWVT